MLSFDKSIILYLEDSIFIKRKEYGRTLNIL